MSTLRKTYFDLIELIEEQAKIMKQQSEIIAKLTNDSIEQENLINQLLKEEV